MNLRLEKVNFDTLYNDVNFKPLIDEYAEESAIKGLPPINVKVELYKHYENAGAIYIVAAYYEDKLVGFATVLSPVLPHFSVLVSVCESLFVAKDYRKTRAGLKLIDNCEKYAASLGSPGILISTPIGGVLDELLSLKEEYVETNKVYFRKFNNE